MDRRAFLAASAVTASGLALRAAAAATEGPFGATATPVPVPPAQGLPLGPLPSTRYPDTHVEALDKRWNAALAAGRGALWSPTIRCAVIAGTPWLEVYRPGCRTSRAIDIRTIDRHPLASVGSLALGLRCSWCLGSAPMPVITGLHALPPAVSYAAGDSA
jgi:hypothetical protein